MQSPYFNTTVYGCLVTSASQLESQLFLLVEEQLSVWKDIKQDAFHSQPALLQQNPLKLWCARRPDQMWEVYRTMFRGAAVLKRADDENVDSGAETAEWVNLS